MSAKTSPMQRPLSSLPILGIAVVLAGCATADIDQSIAATNRVAAAFTGGQAQLVRSAEMRAANEKQVAELLKKPLTQTAAVQLALLNSPALQTLLAERWGDMAAAAQAGRIANPIFGFERPQFLDELELSRALSFGLLDLLTLPQRTEVAKSRIQQAEMQMTSDVVDQVTQVRQAWVKAVAAQESFLYAQRVYAAADASAELARRMQGAGNFTRLQRAHQQAFYADAASQLMSSQHAVTSSREQLIRLLGFGSGAQETMLTLPERLPDLPKEPLAPARVGGALVAQRLDVRLAKLQLDAASQAQGLGLITSLTDIEVGVRRDTIFDNAAAGKNIRRGYTVDVRLPIFDWGDAQRASLNANTLTAAYRLEATVAAAGSQLRETYSAYRTAYDLARHYRDEVVPLRKLISEENGLRYNGMIIGVFELLADTRDQIGTVMAAISAQQQFWLADAALQATLIGKPTVAQASAVAGKVLGGGSGH
ncbi:MAG: TolC family protein [Rhodocyclaceae bacterium]|nr:MAG: TolC family protein [Rhodocyclaceae bacterium]